MQEKMKPTVREAVPGDMPVIWAFIRKKAAFDRWLDRIEATPEKLAAAMFGPTPLMGILLAELDGEVAGFASYYYTFSTYMARRCVWIDDLYVDDDKRRRGVGTELLQEIVRLSVRQDCARIEWVAAATNSKAIGFYERMGVRLRHASRLCRMDEKAILSLNKTL